MNLICWAMDFQGRKWVRSPFNLENSRSSQINRRRAPSTISSSARAVRKRLQNSEPYDVSIHRTRSDEWRRNVGTVGCRDINHLTFLLLTMLSLTQLQHFRFYGNLLSRTIKRISFWMLNWGVFFFRSSAPANVIHIHDFRAPGSSKLIHKKRTTEATCEPKEFAHMQGSFLICA